MVSDMHLRFIHPICLQNRAVLIVLNEMFQERKQVENPLLKPGRPQSKLAGSTPVRVVVIVSDHSQGQVVIRSKLAGISQGHIQCKPDISKSARSRKIFLASAFRMPRFGSTPYIHKPKTDKNQKQ